MVLLTAYINAIVYDYTVGVNGAKQNSLGNYFNYFL